MINKIKELIKYNDLAFIFAIAFSLNLFIEILSRSNIFSAIFYLLFSPMYFLFNTSIIAFSLSISLLFKKKRFVASIIGTLWFILGIANFIVLCYRITPLSCMDLIILKLDENFLQSYLNIGLIILLALAISLFVFFVVFIFKKTKSTKIELKKSLTFSFGLFVFIIAFYFINISINSFEPTISNMQEASEKHGFVTCFVRSTFERGIDKPNDYSEIAVEKVLDNIETDEDTSIYKPNIIVVQLESFFNPQLLKDIKFNKDPIPTFTYLKENYTNGMFDVSVVGAGTANTEFEVLTGMNLKFFGTGEYPYNTFLQEQTCDSLAYNLKNLGYGTFAIHNNTGTFYGRNLVYPNLGFDNFISSEFMTNYTTTQEGWIKDKYLTPEIIKCLKSTEERDFIFTVSVQGHGAYPTEKLINPKITVKSSPFDIDLQNQIEYYANQIHEMDQFVFDLMMAVNQLNERTMIVFYGDHLPALKIYEEDLITHNNYQTEYAIWSNFGVNQKDEDINSYQISSKISELTNLYTGILPEFSLQHSDSFNYLDKLQLLQYDMVYGDYYALNECQPVKTDMKMGLGEISIDLSISANYLVFTSDSFNENSQVFSDDTLLESTIKNNRIYVPLELINLDETLSVKQVSPDNVILSETIVPLVFN